LTNVSVFLANQLASLTVVNHGVIQNSLHRPDIGHKTKSLLQAVKGSFSETAFEEKDVP